MVWLPTTGHCDTKTYLNNPGESVPTGCLVIYTELQSSPVSSIFAKWQGFPHLDLRILRWMMLGICTTDTMMVM